jgi:hypothetical protein
VDGVADRLSDVGRYVARLNYLVVLAVGLVLVAVKTAASIPWGGINAIFLPAAAALPAPASYVSSSVGPLALARIVGVTTDREWVLLFGSLLVVTFVLMAVMIGRRDASERAPLALLVVSVSAVSVQFAWIGQYDVFILAGISFWMLARSMPVALVGAAVAVTGNVEQMVMAGMCAVLATFLPPLRPYRSRGVALLVVALGGYLLIQAWFRLNDFSGSRLSLLADLFKPSAYGFVMDLPGTIWSWYGPMWIVAVGVLLLCTTWMQRLIWLAAIVVIPGAANLLTLDGPRVFAMVALPVSLMLAVWAASTVRAWGAKEFAVFGAFVVVFVLAPTADSAWDTFGPWLVDVNPLTHAVQSLLDTWAVITR